jgi:Domain of unknown function (DUF4259)
MGAWAASAFGNDTAMDWVAELERSGAHAVTAALAAAVEADEYLEAPEAEEAVAAAEVVATVGAITVFSPRLITEFPHLGRA